MAFHGKRIKDAYKNFDRLNLFPVEEAINIVLENKISKFDETIEISVNLGVDSKHSDQNVRGIVSLPNGTGKSVKVAVFANESKAEDARKAGADFVGAEDLAEKVQSGDINFDRCIATPDMMAVVGKLGKVLGPKGLMPNPKLGTVTQNVAEAVKAAKGGEIEFRSEKAGIVHAGIGKSSFETNALIENVNAFVEAILKAKPTGVKGVYFESATISSTMGPGVKIDVASFAN